MHRPLTAILVASLVLGIAACGEKDEPEAVAPTVPSGAGNEGTTTTAARPDGDGANQRLSPEAEVESAIQGVLGGNDPAYVCTEVATARYVKRAYGDEQGCRAAIAKQQKFEVVVSSINIQGTTASARAKPTAGPNKGETIRVELVDEGGTWKVDSAVSNAPAGP